MAAESRRRGSTAKRLSALTTSSAPAPSELVLTRIIDAPRALVFEAWTDPKYVAQWWGPQGQRATHARDSFAGLGWANMSTPAGLTGKPRSRRSSFHDSRSRVKREKATARMDKAGHRLRISAWKKSERRGRSFPAGRQRWRCTAQRPDGEGNSNRLESGRYTTSARVVAWAEPGGRCPGRRFRSCRSRASPG